MIILYCIKIFKATTCIFLVTYHSVDTMGGHTTKCIVGRSIQKTKKLINISNNNNIVLMHKVVAIELIKERCFSYLSCTFRAEFAL